MKLRKSATLLLILTILLNISISVSFANTIEEDIELADIEVERYVLDNLSTHYAYDDYVRVIVELKEESALKYFESKGLKYDDINKETKKVKEKNILQTHQMVKSDLRASSIDMKHINSFTTIINGFSGKVKKGDLTKIRNHPLIKDIYISQEFEMPVTQSIDILEKQLLSTNQSSLEYNGEGMVIAIIDTGIDPNHKDMNITREESCKLSEDEIDRLKLSEGLPGKYYSSKVPYGYNYFDQNHIILDLGPNATDHGMHVAGIAAANGQIKGSAPEAQLLAMKVFSNNPEFTSTFEDIYIKAIEDSVKLGADVINISLGSPSGFYFKNSPMDKAISLAIESGVTISISAGNAGHATYGWSQYPYIENPDIGTVSTPSIIRDAISVAASGIDNQSNTSYMAEFSSWGVTPTLELKPEITANGVSIYSTLQNNKYGVKSGTSMAAPYVAGEMAKILQYINENSSRISMFSEVTPLERVRLAKNLAMNTATILYDEYSQPYSPRRQGAGMINAKNATKTPVILLDKITYDSKVELKDFSDTTFNINLEAINYGTEDITYDVELYVLGDLVSNNNNQDFNRNILRSQQIRGVTVSKPDSITISGNKTRDIDISIDISNGLIPGIDEPLEKNMFIEGFVVLKSQNSPYPDISIPYVGFFGEWSSPDSPKILDGMSKFGEKSFYSSSGMVDSNGNYMGWAPGSSGGYNGSYDRIAISPETSSTQQGTMAVVSFMRNAEEVQYNILDSNGKLLRKLTTEKNVIKNYFNYGHGYTSSYNTERYWDGKVNNRVVQDGKYYYQIKARIQDSSEWQEKVIPVTVDTKAPKIKISYDELEKTISWVSTDEGIGLSYFKVFVDNKNIYGNQVVVAKKGQSSYQISYDKQVNYNIEVIAYDFAGNYSSSKYNKIEDDEAPYVFVTKPQMFDSLTKNTVNFQGYVLEDTELEYLKINGQAISYSYNPSKLQYEFSYTLEDLEEGANQIRIEAKDINGNEIDFMHIFYVDTVKPILELDHNESMNNIMPLYIPGSGNTIIFRNEAYDRIFLSNNEEIKLQMKDALTNGENVYVKLEEGIYIDQSGALVTELYKDKEITYHNKNGFKAIYKSLDSEIKSFIIDVTMGDNLGIFRLFVNDSEIYVHEIDSMLALKPVTVKETFLLEAFEGENKIILTVEDLAGNRTIKNLNILIE